MKLYAFIYRYDGEEESVLLLYSEEQTASDAYDALEADPPRPVAWLEWIGLTGVEGSDDA